MKKRVYTAFIILVMISGSLFSQQVADTNFNPVIARPEYAKGEGRYAMFGEAAMFTAQLAGNTKTRTWMNSDYTEENYKLLLNIIHWLAVKLND